MKLMTFLQDEKERLGVVSNDEIMELTQVGKLASPSLKDILTLDALEAVKRLVKEFKPSARLRDVEIRPLIPNPNKIVCVGLNFRSHADNLGRAVSNAPSLFLKVPDTLIGHGGNMIRPRASTHFDYEGELAVIIGKPGRHIAEVDALKHVAGYSCFVDGSVRDFQSQSVTAGKNFAGTTPFGPWMVTADEIPDYRKLMLTTTLNGVEVQRGGLDTLIHSIEKVISYVTTFMRLEPGDVIAMGTPSGVGLERKPPLWLKAGDRLEVEISEIGKLTVGIVDE